MNGHGVETLRYYEREGLLAKPARVASGYRQYPAEAVERVQFIRRAQLLGFQLKDIKELLALRDDPDADSGEVREKAVAKLADVGQRIKDLEAMRTELTRLVAASDGSGPASDCPVLTSIRLSPHMKGAVRHNRTGQNDFHTPAINAIPGIAGADW